MHMYHSKASDGTNNVRRHFKGRSAKRILPVTIDYSAPFNKNAKRMTQYAS